MNVKMHTAHVFQRNSLQMKKLNSNQKNQRSNKIKSNFIQLIQIGIK